jgi:hypothetical protein
MLSTAYAIFSCYYTIRSLFIHHPEGLGEGDKDFVTKKKNEKKNKQKKKTPAHTFMYKISID